VINGTERVVVTQLVRSPPAPYLMEPKDREEAGVHREPDARTRIVA